MKSKRKLLLTLFLCFTMVLGMLPITVLAANTEGDPRPFSFKVDMDVIKGGDVAPGKETFEFELEYGVVSQNSNYSYVFTPDDNVTLADCGIEFTSKTITTNGEGVQTFTLGGTIDLAKLDPAHHWQNSTGNDSITKQVILLRLTEKNDGKPGWTYSDAVRYLTIKVKGDEVSTDVGLLANDVYDNNFENTYTAYSFTVKKTDNQGKPLAGAIFSLTSLESTASDSFEAVSDADGIATFVVPDGNYTLAEKTAPKGYTKSDKTYIIGVRTFDGTNWGGESGVYFYDPDEPDYSNYKYIRYSEVTFINELAPVKVEETKEEVKTDTAKKSPATGNGYEALALFAVVLASGAGIVAVNYGRKRKENAE